MTVSIYNPSRIIDRLFDEVEKNWGASKPFFSPAIDVVEEKEAYLLRTELPGVNKEEIKVEVKQNSLVISGEKKDTFEKKEENGYAYRESAYGSFSRSFSLPPHVDTGAILAEHKDGVLTLKLPKKPEAGSRFIDVH